MNLHRCGDRRSLDVVLCFCGGSACPGVRVQPEPRRVLLGPLQALHAQGNCDIWSQGVAQGPSSCPIGEAAVRTRVFLSHNVNYRCLRMGGC